MQATRQFVQKDQNTFAAASGDFNPMHMDALAARRTQAGAPVVHGMHALLWLLDEIVRHRPTMPPIAGMKVSFAKMLYVGETVEARIKHLDEKALRAEVLVDNTPAITVRATFGPALPQPLGWEEVQDAPLFEPTEPLDPEGDGIAARSGRLRLPDTDTLAGLFPDASHYLGARRIAALARSSYLVGMVVPGLHSIYTGLTFRVCNEADTSEHLLFKVTLDDPRYRLVQQELWGGGIAAELETMIRLPPVRQAPIEAIAPLIGRGEFAGTTALIVGGSRGLGELTAKILVAGGARVVITYARGKAEAENLAAELRAWGGACEGIAYDVLDDAGKQLADLPEMPSHIYYFATPPLMSRKSDVFVTRRYDIFRDFYVTGFERLVKAASSRPRLDNRMDVFYPSSVAIDEQTAGMIEYAKAKQVGEDLCAKLMAQMPGLHIVTSRLPRMLTDLTATVQAVETADPLAVLLPIIRERMNARRSEPVQPLCDAAEQSASVMIHPPA
jgi:NADP-dependent 3-hydroxy acid dehydrogenase YdfG